MSGIGALSSPAFQAAPSARLKSANPNFAGGSKANVTANAGGGAATRNRSNDCGLFSIPLIGGLLAGGLGALKVCAIACCALPVVAAVGIFFGIKALWNRAKGE